MYVVLFMPYKVVLTFKFTDETLVCDHSSKRYWAVLSSGTRDVVLTIIVYMVVPRLIVSSLWIIPQSEVTDASKLCQYARSCR